MDDIAQAWLYFLAGCMNLSVPTDTQLHNPHFHIGFCKMVRREKPKLIRMPSRTTIIAKRCLERYRRSTRNLGNRSGRI
jgi:hypothetical protein